jgi:hypothetical protein
MKASALTIVLFGLAAGVQAHVADLSPTQHAGDHSWLALGLIPLFAQTVSRVRGRR